MLAILTYKDIELLTEHDPPLREHLQEHFKNLHATYCSNGLPPLGQFSLASVGEIILAEDYSEVKDLLFEQVETIAIGSVDYYCCYWARDNDRCCSVYLGKDRLTPQQIETMDKEY